jgi:hypothetical protein
LSQTEDLGEATVIIDSDPSQACDNLDNRLEGVEQKSENQHNSMQHQNCVSNPRFWSIRNTKRWRECNHEKN